MKVRRILNDLIKKVTNNDLNDVVKEALKALVISLISGAKLTVTDLGRNIESDALEKHRIKRSDRFLSNWHFSKHIRLIYAKLCQFMIGDLKNPLILIDWSYMDNCERNALLRAAVAVEGRALTLFEEVHPYKKQNCPNIHEEFIKRLFEIMPQDCKPIIVTDGGFRGPWFKLIKRFGWDYVGRVRNNTYCKPEGSGKDGWHHIKTLFGQATSRAKALGLHQLAKSKPNDCYLVLFKKDVKGRKDLDAKGKKRRKSKRSRACAARESEPWLLATSLEVNNTQKAKEIAKIYSTRMQIEESFRDLKTGINMNSGNTKTIKRLHALLLIALLAQFILFIIGVTVKLLGKHRQYQANSEKKKNVLSFQFIAQRAIKDKRMRLLKKQWLAGLEQVRQLMKDPKATLQLEIDRIT